MCYPRLTMVIYLKALKTIFFSTNAYIDSFFNNSKLHGNLKMCSENYKSVMNVLTTVITTL